MHINRHAILRVALFSLLFLPLVIFTTDMASAKDTVYKEDSLLYWRFDDNGEEQFVRIPTDNVPINFTYTYTDTGSVPAEDNSMYFQSAARGTDPNYLDTLLGAGVVRSLGDADDSIVFDTDEKNYRVWRKNTGYGDYVYTMPSVLTNSEILTYKVNYKGNAILVPCDSLEFATDVQGREVVVKSEDNVKLEYAIAKPEAKANSIIYKLSRNKVTVRLEADYTYTRLIPLTSGKYTEGIYATDNIVVAHYRDGELDYYHVNHRNSFDKVWTALYGNSNTVNTIKCSENYWSIMSSDSLFTSNAEDYLSGNVYPVYSNCPVTSVKETVHFYKDIECYVIDTNDIRSNNKDMDVYLKNIHKSCVTKEAYKFVKAKTKFAVKYKYGDGFTVSGITRNTGLNWVHDTEPIVSSEGYKGELIEWWPGSSTVHFYTTPERINDDIPVELYIDNGVILYFCDANKPVSTVKVKIPARQKSPKVTLKTTKDGTVNLYGLKAGLTGIRLCNNDDCYISLPDALISGTNPAFSAAVNMPSWGEITEEHGNPGFYLYTGGSDKKATVGLFDLVNINETTNLNAFGGMFIEAVNFPKGNKPDSDIIARYINEQPVFDVCDSITYDSITLQEGLIKIADADSNNQYEYSIPDSTGEYSEWKIIKSSEPKKESAVVDGATICIRKKAVETNDDTFFLPSTYIKLTYNGQGAGVPCTFYMADLYKNEPVTLKFINDTGHNVTINSGTELAPDAEFTIDNVFANVKYSIDGGKLKKEYTVAAALSLITEEFSDFTDTTVYLSKLREGMTDATIIAADYTAYADKTEAFEYVDKISGDTNGYMKNVSFTIPDTDLTGYYTDKATGTRYSYTPVHLLKMMMQ